MTLQLPKNKFDNAIGILWVDLETTGTDQDVDDIIEIGSILTDFEFNTLDEFSIVIRPSTYSLGQMMFNPIVREMHTANGLLEECINSKVDIAEAEQKMMSWMNHVINKKTTRGPVEKFRFMLAGSGVGHFDRRFIKEYMPKLDKILNHGPLDIGAVRRFLRVSGQELAPVPSSDAKNHRALDDIRMHLEEARAYREALIQRLLMPL